MGIEILTKNTRQTSARIISSIMICILTLLSLKVWDMSRANFDKYRGEIMHWFPSFQWALGPVLIIAALAGNSGTIFDTANIFGFLAIILAAVNIFGGFLVTQRMLAMYKKKKKDK